MALTTEDIRECTLLSLAQIPRHFEDEFKVFKFTIDTRYGRVSMGNYPQSVYDSDLADFQIYGIRLAGDVLWGDGTSDSLNNARPFDSVVALSHTYNEPGVYHVSIVGNLTYLTLGTTAIYYSTSVVYSFDVISIDSAFPSGAIAGQYVFANCANLTSVPENLFSKIGNSVSLFYGFYNCYSLMEIPEGLLNGVRILDLDFCFTHCIQISSIPGELFENVVFPNTSNISLQNCFAQTGITSIPSGLFNSFKRHTHLYDLRSCFSSTAITEVPEGLLNSFGTSEMLLSSCFNGCASLTQIHGKMFYGSTNIGLLDNCFANCSSLQIIPANLFEGIGLSEYGCSFSGCFMKTPITSIPADLFAPLKAMHPVVPYGNRYALEFDSCFASCASLSSIPDYLFNGIYGANTFAGCFGSCTSIASIPKHLFGKVHYIAHREQYSGSADTVSFYSCFAGCTSLTTIPSELFDVIYEIPSIGMSEPSSDYIDFTTCFRDCTGITEIPSGLFKAEVICDHTQDYITFNGCFTRCTNLATVPGSIFDCTAHSVLMSNCFSYCSSIVALPSGLFDGCETTISFYSCFMYCTGLGYVPMNLFDDCDIVGDFKSCFSRCSAITSNVPELWITHASAQSGACYRNCTNAANYADIPASWK